MKYFVLFLIAMLTIVTSESSDAQDFSRERVLGLAHILGHGGVKAELDLSNEQLERLIGYGVSIDGKLQDAFSKFSREYNPRFSDSQLEQLKLQLADDIQTIRDNERERIESVLLPEQLRRLHEIRTQYFRRIHNQGVEMLGDDLNLSQEQIGKIKEARTKLVQRIQKHAAGFGRGPREPLGAISADEIPDSAEPAAPILTRAELMEIVEGEKAKTRQEVFRILTARQQAQLREMEGEEYTFQTAYSQPKDEENEDK